MDGLTGKFHSPRLSTFRTNLPLDTSPCKCAHMWFWVSVLYRLPTNEVTTDPTTLPGNIRPITSRNLARNTWTAKHQGKQRTNQRTKLIFIDNEKKWRNHSRNENSFVALKHVIAQCTKTTAVDTTSIRTSQAPTKPSAHITPTYILPYSATATMKLAWHSKFEI
jgi:hypothetical protein